MRTCESENAGIEVNKRNKAAVDVVRRRNRMRDMGTSRGAQLIRTLSGCNRCLFQVNGAVFFRQMAGLASNGLRKTRGPVTYRGRAALQRSVNRSEMGERFSDH